MTKPFKLRLNFPSFQFCRSKKSSTLARSPSPATRIFTPVNPKVFDITHPKSPAPPPSSPNHPSCKRNTSSKILPIGSESVEPRLCSSSNMESPAYKRYSILEKLYNTPDISEEFDLGFEKNNNDGNDQCIKDQFATSFSMSFSSADNGWFSSEAGNEPNDESESLPSLCSSLESSCDFGHPVKIPSNQKAPHGSGTERKRENGKVRRLKCCVSMSNNEKESEKIKLATSAMLPESDSPLKKTVLGRLLPCRVDGKVNESYAIMKKSADPFDDFKMSMLEMIIEKQLSEAEDLEKLLMCFLSLNSKEHHEIIVAAFSEVWDELFSTNLRLPNSSN